MADPPRFGDEPTEACELRSSVTLLRGAHFRKWFLRNALTKELVELPEQWHQHDDAVLTWLDDEDEGYVLADAEPEGLDVEDVFKTTAYITPSRVIALRVPYGATSVIVGSVDRETKYQGVALHSDFRRGFDVWFEAAVFDVPRSCGSRSMWSLADLFDALEVGSSGWSYGDWAKDHWKSWQNRFSGGVVGVAQASQPYRRGAEQTLDPQLVLPWRSVSTVGLVNLLCRFAWATSKQSGSTASHIQDLAARLLATILSLIGVAAWTLLVNSDDHATIQPPPLGPSGYAPLIGRGTSSFVEWPSADPGNAAGCIPESWKRMGLRPGARCCVLSLLREATQSLPQASHVFDQLVSGVERQIDRAIALAAGAKAVGTNVVLGAGWSIELVSSLTSTSDGDLGLETGLTRQLLNIQAAIGVKPMFVSWSSDKSHVGVKGVQNMTASLPNNIGFAAPPVEPLFLMHA